MDDADTKEFEDSLELDDILPKLGEFGRYQKLLLWLVCLPACIPCGFCAFNQLFMADIPDHWCKVSELSNVTEAQRKKLAIPNNNGSFSKCERYAVNWSEVLELYNVDVEPDESWPKEPCMQGWEYDRSKVVSSIVIDFNLVCDKDIYPTLGLTALNMGGPVGVYFFGMLNDRIGRKKSFFACLATLISGSILTACSPNFWMWAASRFFVGLTLPAIYQIPFIISLELVGPNYRSFVTVMTCIFYTFGLMGLAGVTYLIRDWVHLALVTSTPFLLYTIFWFFLPESPRWLLAKGRFDEALKILEVLAKVNNHELPEDFKQQLIVVRNRNQKSKSKRNVEVWALCRTPNMRTKTVLITLNWFANTMVYMGLSYYGPALGNNPYLSFFLSSLVEIPSYLLCWIIMDRWGRRWPMCLSMVISGISCIGTVVVPSDAVTTTLVLYLISKSAISASFLIIYPFAGELYPTKVRGLGIGTSAYVGGLGLIVIPFITYLGTENLILPLIIMGTVSVFSGLLGLRLPETLHHRLPQTLEEGEEFGKNFTMEDCFRCIPLKSTTSAPNSYENLELTVVKEVHPEEVPLQKRLSMRKLTPLSSFMDTQKNYDDGTMKMAYWV